MRDIHKLMKKVSKKNVRLVPQSETPRDLSKVSVKTGPKKPALDAFLEDLDD